MTPASRRLLASLGAAAVLVSTLASDIGMSTYASLATTSRTTTPGQDGQATASLTAARATQAPAAVGSDQVHPHGPSPSRVSRVPATTDLTVTIDELSSIDIAPGQLVEVSGWVTNPSELRWTDAQVYLTMSAEPASSKGGLDGFALIEGGFGTPVEKIGLFEQIGALPPGERKPYSLSVPFRRLPINQTPGVYHVGVIVLAGNRDGRDAVADARADTLMPLLPGQTADKPASTNLLTLLPLSAPVSRHPDGAFTDDTLAAAVSEGGRLRNVLDFATSAPSDTLELVVDPAVLQACQDMADGYVLRAAKDPDGTGIEGDADNQRAAADWLADLESMVARQGLTLLPWGSPASSVLAEAELPAVIEAAVLAGQTFAAEANLSGAITNWPNRGLTTRRGLALTRSAGAAVHVVSRLSLPALRGDAIHPDEYPPAQVTLGTVDGPLTALVTRSEIGGVAFTSTVDMLDLRQAVAAEATVRALSSPRAQTSVLAAPLHWNPQADADADFGSVYDFPTVSATTLADAETFPATDYTGPVRLPKNAPPGFPTKLVEIIADLQSTGWVFVELLTEQRRVSLDFDRELASAGSYWWQRHPNRATSLIRRSKRDKAAQVRQVTISGPSFVTLSSESGRFPLTVTNGLDVSVTVKVDVVAQDAAFQIEPLKPIVLEPGRQRDVEVVSRAKGSGLTAARARLSTSSELPFGRPVDFDIRATQIGLLIWVVFGSAAAVIVVASGLRIYRRIRTTGFTPRGELPR